MSNVKKIIELAQQVFANEQPSSNTHQLVGSLLMLIADYLKSMPQGGISGYIYCKSESDFPQSPTDKEKRCGFVLNGNIYFYVGEGGDFSEGRYQNGGRYSGPDGKSAYEVAVDNGFEGTAEEWLASLKEISDYQNLMVESRPENPQTKIIYGIPAADGQSWTEEFWDGSKWVVLATHKGKSVETDETLTKEGAAADAKVVGEKLEEFTANESLKEMQVDWVNKKRIKIDGIIEDYYNTSITKPIFLKKGEKIKLNTPKLNENNAPVVIAVTDSESSTYTPVVTTNYNGGTDFEFKAYNNDCYVVLVKVISAAVHIYKSEVSGSYKIGYRDSNIGSKFYNIEKQFSSYEGMLIYDEVKNVSYRPKQQIVNGYYTFIANANGISKISGYLLGDNNNFSLVFFSVSGQVIDEYSVRNSNQNYVDMEIPDGVSKIGVLNTYNVPPQMSVVYKNDYLKKLNAVIDEVIIDDNLSELDRNEFNILNSYHYTDTSGVITTTKDIGRVVVGKIKGYKEISASLVPYSGWTPVCFYDKDFVPIKIIPAASGYNSVQYTEEVPNDAVYFALCSRTKDTDFTIYIKKGGNTINELKNEIALTKNKNIVGNPYDVITEDQEVDIDMSELALTDTNTFRVYVDSNNGNDNNSGTENSPVKTLAKAIELSNGKNRYINLKDGVYRLSEDLHIDNSTFKTKIYSPTGKTEIKGSQLLTNPQDEGNNIVSFSFSGGNILHEIFVNDEVRFPASAGNDIVGDIVEAKYKNYTRNNLTKGYQEFKISLDSEDVAKLEKYVNIGYVTFYRDWRSIVGIIKSVDKVNNTISIYVAPSHKTGTVEGVYGGVQKIIIKNINETLNCYSINDEAQPSLRPGSFFYDLSNNKIFYHLKEGETISDITVEIPLNIKIDIFSPCLFNNVKFSQFGGTLFNSEDYEGACQDHQGGYRMSGNIIVHSSDTYFMNCEFSGFTLHCIKYLNGSSNSCIRNCYFHDTGCAAVMIGECDQNAENVPSNITITNCVVKRNGQTLPESCAYIMTFAENCEFSHNDISECPYSAFNIGYVWYRDTPPTGLKSCRISHNEIYLVGHDWLNDMGAIYTLGDTQGIHINNNFIHDFKTYTAERSGIYLDEGTKNAYVYNNVVLVDYNHSHWNRKNYIYNNIFTGQYLINNATIDVTLYHNIFIGFGKDVWGYCQPQILLQGNNATANIIENLYWGEGFKTAAPSYDINAVLADPNFSDIKNRDFTVYNTDNIDKIGFKSFVLNAGVKNNLKIIAEEHKEWFYPIDN